MTATAHVRVRVPATVANLGPGFDCLGAALGTYLDVAFSAAPAGSDERVGGDDSIGLADDLTLQAFRRAHEAAGTAPPPVRLEVLASYPRARGMGSSASAIVAGLVGARALGALELGEADLARLAVAIEGHPDNVLPALLGGLVLARRGGAWTRFVPGPAVVPRVLVAPEPFATSAARGILPAVVPVADAVANVAAAATLVAVLTGGAEPGELLDATADRLHEPYRLPVMGITGPLHARLRAAGIPTALAGAGPSLVCLVPAGGHGAADEILASELPEGWVILDPGWDVHGAQVLQP